MGNVVKNLLALTTSSFGRSNFSWLASQMLSSDMDSSCLSIDQAPDHMDLCQSWMTMTYQNQELPKKLSWIQNFNLFFVKWFFTEPFGFHSHFFIFLILVAI